MGAVPENPPIWVRDAVFYQIFPDRFRNGDPGNDPVNVRPWGAPPTQRAFFGGDLAGIIQSLPYLLDLGVNALYLTPIFQAASNHRYDTYDYFRIDPRLGDEATFRRLLEEAHRNGIRIILDAVLNHCGRGFFAFSDLLENGPDSAYRDWFHVQGFPLYAYEERHPPNYTCWWNVRALPKFNTDNPHVREYLFSVVRYWTSMGIDGWRLDVPNEIDDDAFWQEFRAIVKEINPEAYIVGEIWHGGERWLRGDQFDGIMNYALRQILLEWLVEGRYRARAFAKRLQDLLQTYRPEVLFAQLNLLGSHDTERLMTLAGGDRDTVRLLYLFLLTWPGAPCIYYGDEVGLPGGRDPDCRRCFPWDPVQWDQDLWACIRRLIRRRRELPALRFGKVRILLAHPRQDLYAHGRGEGPEAAVMVLNAGDLPRIFDLPLEGMRVPVGTLWLDREHNRAYRVRNGRLEGVCLPPRSGAILAAG